MAKTLDKDDEDEDEDDSDSEMMQNFHFLDE